SKPGCAFLDCHPETRKGEGSPVMHRSKLPAAGLLNQVPRSKISNLQDRPKRHEQILPPPDQLRCADLITRRQKDDILYNGQQRRFTLYPCCSPAFFPPSLRRSISTDGFIRRSSNTMSIATRARRSRAWSSSAQPAKPSCSRKPSSGRSCA